MSASKKQKAGRARRAKVATGRTHAPAAGAKAKAAVIKRKGPAPAIKPAAKTPGKVAAKPVAQAAEPMKKTVAAAKPAAAKVSAARPALPRAETAASKNIPVPVRPPKSVAPVPPEDVEDAAATPVAKEPPQQAARGNPPALPVPLATFTI